MMIVHQKFFVFQVGRPQCVVCGTADAAERLMFDDLLQDQSHVVSRSIMILIRKTVRIRKMSVGTAQFGCPFVHHLRESFRGAGDVFCDGVAAFIGGFQQNSIQTLFHGQNLAFVSGDMAAGIIDGIDCIMRKYDLFIQVAVLQRQKHCHDFGDTGGIMLVVYIFCVEDSAGGGFHHDRGFCVDLGTGWPVFPGIGLNIHIITVFGGKVPLFHCREGRKRQNCGQTKSRSQYGCCISI